jgi:CRISPR-associated protein Cmr1
MEKLTVTLKTITPLFLGGAEPVMQAELCAPSIKGAMRLWYRAIDPEVNNV